MSSRFIRFPFAPSFEAMQKRFASLEASDIDSSSAYSISPTKQPSPRMTITEAEALRSPICLQTDVRSVPSFSGDNIPSVADLSLEVLLQIARSSPSNLRHVQDGIINLSKLIGLEPVTEVKALIFKLNACLFLPASVQILIMNQCPLQALFALSGTCRYYFHFIKNYIQRRVRNLISRFGLCPERLFHIMRYYGSIIGGSCALSVVGAEVNSFEPLEMTVYLPLEYRNTLCASLFPHLQYVGSNSSKDYNPCVSLVEWYALSRSNGLPLHIIAVFTTSKTPIEALFHSDYSITLNAITSKGVFSAYRTLTSVGRSLVGNKRAFPSLKFSTKIYNNPLDLQTWDRQAIVAACGIALPYWTMPPFLFLILGMQYKEREVHFVRHLSGFINHECRADFSCPMTSRTMADTGCLFFPFSKFKPLPLIPEYGNVIPIIPSIPEFCAYEPTLVPRELVIWFFGGGYGCTSMGSTFPRLIGTISVPDSS